MYTQYTHLLYDPKYQHKYRAKGENLTIYIEILCVWLVGPPPTGTETQPLHPRCQDNRNVDDLMEDCSRRSTL